MGHDLQFPGTDAGPDWDSLYRARADEVVVHRPFFTGDVFRDTTVQTIGNQRTRTAILLQHPCALRTNGVDLVQRLLVAEVKPFPLLTREQWTGHYGRMPLPDLDPAAPGKKRHQAAFFDAPYLVAAQDLTRVNRAACLSPVGVNILLQRWVAHNSRAVIPTATYQEVTRGPYEEADLIEEWCDERVADGVGIDQATAEAVAWLREDLGEGTPVRQEQLTDPQRSSGIRKDMRRALGAMS